MRALAYFSLLCLGTLGQAMFNPIHPNAILPIARRLQGNSQYECQKFLSSTLGSEFFGCFFGIAFSFPMANASNNCLVDYAPFCSSACYKSMTDGFDYIVKTGACLDMFSGGGSTDGCNANPSSCFSNEICVADNCVRTCNVTADCIIPSSDPCTPNDTSTICVQPAGAMAPICIENTTQPVVTPSVAAISYSFKMFCAQDSQGDYCLNVLEENAMKNVTSCAPYGCCLGTVLQAGKYCFNEVLPPEANAIFGLTLCPEASQTCSNIPLAKTYCAANGVERLGLSSLAVIVLIFTSLWAM